MPGAVELRGAPQPIDVARFVARQQPFLATSVQELLQNSALARKVLGEAQIFEELRQFESAHGTPVTVKFLDWKDAFRHFTDYVSDPTNPPVVAQLGHTWAAYFRSLNVVPYERRYNWDIRLLWYWKHLVNPEAIQDDEGFLAVCRKLRRAPPPELMAPFAIPTGPSWDLLHDLSIWLYSAGLPSLISVDKKLGLFPWTEAVFAGPKGQRAAGFLIDLAREGLLVLPEQEGTAVAEDFLGGKYAMVILGVWVAGRAESRMGPGWEARVGATMPPVIGEGPPTTVKLGSLLVVLDPSRGKNQAGVTRARFLVDFLTSAASQRRCAQSLGDLPGNPEALSAFPHHHLFSKALEQARPYPEIAEWGPVVENLVTRDNLYAFWKRLAALREPQTAVGETDQENREKLIQAALQSAQVQINRSLSLGKLSALWPWLVGALMALSVVTCISIWRRQVERRENHRQLADSEAKYRDLYDHAPDMFCSVDVTTGRIVECNQTLVYKTGYSKEEIIGCHIFDMYHPDCRKEVEKALEAFRETGEVGELELQLQTKEGKKLVVSVNVSAIRDADGKVVRTRSVWRDITQRKQAEEVAEQLRQELTHVARVATMGELAASLAHELSQPLTAIVSNAQAAQRLLVKNAPDVDEARDALTDIAGEGQRAGDVIRALRSLLKKGHLDTKEVDINEIIREVLFLLGGQAPLKKISVGLDLDPGLPPVLADRIQLQQVILNLVLNASEAMEHTEVAARELMIRTSKNDAQEIEVGVQDTGVGLDQEMGDRIFDAFFTTKPAGLGMGLSVSRTIIESQGGKLWATPNPDRGATFHFTLPLDRHAQGLTPRVVIASPLPSESR